MALVPATLKKFPLVYWTVMTSELMERGGYYLMIPIIFYHAKFNLGINEALAVSITMFMYPFQYGIPIFSGALGEKIGYKKQIIFAFSCLTVAYIFLSYATNAIMMIAGVMFVGFSIGSYKPLVGATIAKSTASTDRHFAYSIYYWVVNFAAAVFPTIWFALEVLGVLDKSMYSNVFRIGALFAFINIFIALFIFKEVPRTGEVKTVRDVGRNISTAFKDKKFVVMVLLIGGFWALYSTMLNVLSLCLFDFKFVPNWFTPMLLGIFNPMTIILLGFQISKWSERMESLKVVMAGIGMYLIGLVIIAFTLNWYGVAIGVVIASIGEFMVAPGYYAFISKLAPKEKVSAYLGCNFLSSMLGLAGGTLVFGQLYTIIGVGMGRPKLFYGILIALGLLLLVGFMLYYRAWGQDIIKRARAIREKEEGPAVLFNVDEPSLFKLFDKGGTALLPALFIPIILISTFAMGSDIYYPPPPVEPVVTVTWAEETMQVDSSDYCQEGSTMSVPFNVTGIPQWFNFTLSWQDEQSSRILGVNQPDSFRLTLVSPNNRVLDGASEESFTGSASISVQAPEGAEDLSGDWAVEITCTDAGDIRSRGPFGAITLDPDDGNEWALSGSVTYLSEKEGKG